MTGELTKLLEVAQQYSSNSWLQFCAALLVAGHIIVFIDKVHGQLRKSAGAWKKTLKAGLALAAATVQYLNRMVGGDINRKRRPSIQATLLAGDVLMYWGFAVAHFVYTAIFFLLLALHRPHELKLWAITVSAILVFSFFSMFYRNLGAKSFGQLILLYKEHAGNRRTVVWMSGAIACLFATIGVVEYLAWPLFH